jgi:hypothetical protein
VCDSGHSPGKKRGNLETTERKKAMENQVQDPSTYLTTEELAAMIKYDARTIRDQLKDSVLLEGVHYIRRRFPARIGRWQLRRILSLVRKSLTRPVLVLSQNVEF